MNKLSKVGFILCVAAALTGCGKRPNVMPPSSFVSQPKKLLIAQLSDFENATYVPPPSQVNQGLIMGLIDIAVTANSAHIGPAVSRLVSKPIVDEFYYKPFKSFYQGHNFDVTLAEKPIHANQLSPSKVKEDKYAPYDFSDLKQQYNVEYALILHIVQFSAVRLAHFSSTYGRSNVKAYLIDLSDNSIVGEYLTKNISEYAQGGWDTPPAYYALTQAVRSTLIKALKKLYIVFSTGAIPKK